VTSSHPMNYIETGLPLYEWIGGWVHFTDSISAISAYLTVFLWVADIRWYSTMMGLAWRLTTHFFSSIVLLPGRQWASETTLADPKLDWQQYALMIQQGFYHQQHAKYASTESRWWAILNRIQLAGISITMELVGAILWCVPIDGFKIFVWGHEWLITRLYQSRFFLNTKARLFILNKQIAEWESRYAALSHHHDIHSMFHNYLFE